MFSLRNGGHCHGIGESGRQQNSIIARGGLRRFLWSVMLNVLHLARTQPSTTEWLSPYRLFPYLPGVFHSGLVFIFSILSNDFHEG